MFSIPYIPQQAIFVLIGSGVFMMFLLSCVWYLFRSAKRSEGTEHHTLDIVYNLTDGVVEYSPDLKVHLMNPEAEKLLGIRSWELMGRSLHDFLDGDKYGVIRLVFAKELLGSATSKKGEHIREEVTIPGVNERRLEITTIPIGNVWGKAEHNVKIVRDVTRERLLDKMKSEFVSVAAHQLRTPLTGIKWAISSLAEEASGFSGEQKKILSDAFLATNRLVELINDLLNVARIEEGRFGFAPKPLSIVPVLESAYARFKPVAEEKQIVMDIDVGKNIPMANFDEEKLTIVIDNLIENAIKYTAPSGKIILSVSNKNNWIEVNIEDSGIGIPKNQNERMFTKFFRSRNAQLYQTNGTGLGLYVSKNIIEQHGGIIWFESEEEKGSTFHFSIPIYIQGSEVKKE